MAYGNIRKRNGIKPTKRSGGQDASVELVVNTPDGDYQCITPKVYTDKSSVIQDIDDSDGFITIKQDQALPLTVLALYPRLQTFDR